MTTSAPPSSLSKLKSETEKEIYYAVMAVQFGKKEPPSNVPSNQDKAVCGYCAMIADKAVELLRASSPTSMTGDLKRLWGATFSSNLLKIPNWEKKDTNLSEAINAANSAVGWLELFLEITAASERGELHPAFDQSEVEIKNPRDES